MPKISPVHYPTLVGELRIGTAGWNYPRGRGTWNGIFYPRRSGPRGSTSSRYYAEHFDTVEVNSTFYGQPRAEVTRAWADKTPDGFEFSVKLFQKFTHPRMFADTLKRSMRISPADADAAAIQELAQPNLADLDEFRRGIEPLAARGRLGALLAQFPASFKSGDPEREYLMALLSSLHDFPVAVELRHRSWSDALDDTLTLLNTFQAAWVQIDEPKFRFSIRQNYLPNIRGFYYMRLHGRNAAQWWRHDNAEDRYNYLYSAERAARVQRYGGRRAPTGAKGLPVHEQPLLGEGGRQRGDDEGTTARADRGRLPAGIRGHVSGDGNARSNPDTLAPARVTALRNYSRR